mgnify:CR=1 FL=1
MRMSQCKKTNMFKSLVNQERKHHQMFIDVNREEKPLV